MEANPAKLASSLLREPQTTPKGEGRSKPSEPIIRIPAAAIERLVTDRLMALLGSQTELADLDQPLNLSASKLHEVIQKAQETADAWSTKTAADQRSILQDVLIKVRLRTDHVELVLSRQGLLQAILQPMAPDATRADDGVGQSNVKHEDDLVCIKTENCLEPTGSGLRLVISDAHQMVHTMQLAPLIAQSFMLRETLLNGSHDSIEVASSALHMGRSYMTSRIRLTFLSPRLVKKFLIGDISSTLSPTRLLEASKDLPLKWDDQDRFIDALAS
jgi:hypothetical protein